MTPSSAPITQLLARAGQGDDAARTELWSLIYDELRRMAKLQMAAERPGRTMQPTALVNETYLRLFGQHQVDWQNRCHFFAAAAKVMRRIRIDDARKRNRLKRGGGRRGLSLDESEDGTVQDPALQTEEDPAALLELEEALVRLEQIDPRMAEIIEYRYHGGMTREEIGETIGLAPRTVDQLWERGRRWLYKELRDER